MMDGLHIKELLWKSKRCNWLDTQKGVEMLYEPARVAADDANTNERFILQYEKMHFPVHSIQNLGPWVTTN